MQVIVEWLERARREGMLSEMRRVLRPGGYPLVSTPNVARLVDLVTLFKGRNINDG